MSTVVHNTEKNALSYNEQVMSYNGQVVLFRFPVTLVESSNFTFTEKNMGDAVITIDIKLDKDIDPQFSLDWQVIFRGEVYKLKTLQPPGKKDTTSLQYQYTLTFVPEREELKFRLFANMLQLEDESWQPISYDFSFSGTLKEFVDRFNNNLQYAFPYQWEMVLNPDYKLADPVIVTISNLTIWEVLQQTYDLYGVTWYIGESETGVKQIMVGWTVPEIEHIFEYGKDKGLLSVERVNPLPEIFTRLYGRGSGRNLPHRYFKEESGAWVGDPDANDLLNTMYYTNLMPKAYRDYVRGWNDAEAGKPATPGETTFYMLGYSEHNAGRKIHPTAYAEANTEKWGIREGILEAAEDIYPTIQGVWDATIGRLDEVVDVEPVTNDDFSEKNYDPIVDSFRASTLWGGQFDIINSPTHGIEFKSQEFSINSNDQNTIKYRIASSFINGEALAESDALSGSVSVNLLDSAGNVIKSIKHSVQGVAGTANINPKITVEASTGEFDNIPVGRYQLQIYGNMTYNGAILGGDVQAGGLYIEVGTITLHFNAATGEFKEFFDIWIKDIWGETGSVADVWLPKIGENDLTVMWSDGLLAGEDYEFVVVRDTVYGNQDIIDPNTGGYWGIWEDTSRSFTTVDENGNSIFVRSKYRLRLKKSDAELESSNIVLPNKNQNAKTGDHLFFVNIELPHIYVLNAEQRLQTYLESELAKVDDEFPTYAIKPSSIFCESFAEVESLRAGAKVRVRDVRLVNDSYLPLYVQSLTLRYKEGKLLPEWEMVVSDTVLGDRSSINSIRGEISRLGSDVAYSLQSLEELIKQMERKFLRKDGISDTSYSPTTFTQDVTLGSDLLTDDFRQGDFAGAGGGMYKDAEGATVLEVDKVVARRELRTNEVIVNQVTFFGGKQVFSAAGGEITHVEELPGTLFDDQTDVSMSSSIGWTPNGTNTPNYGVYNGFYCMRTIGNSTAIGVYDAHSLPQATYTGTYMLFSVDVFAEGTGGIRLGNNIAAERDIQITEDMVGKWIRISRLDQLDYTIGSYNPIFVLNRSGSVMYFCNIKAERVLVQNQEPTAYTTAREDTYRCFIETSEGRRLNQFALGDQVYSQRYDSQNNDIIKYYWRLCLGIGNDYVDLSRVTFDGTGIPEAGDNIAQLGSRTDTARQSAIIIDVVRSGGALMTWLDDITAFNLNNKDSINLGRISGKTWAQIFGSMYVGDRSRSTYLEYDAGVLRFRGDYITAKADLTYIEGHFLSTGYIGVGAASGSELAGISGAGSSATSIRFWAGSTYALRASAPFRVQQNGYVYANNVYITGVINATSGTMENVTLRTSGTGSQRIEINSSTRRISLFNSNNVEVGAWMFNGLESLIRLTNPSSVAGTSGSIEILPNSISIMRQGYNTFMSTDYFQFGFTDNAGPGFAFNVSNGLTLVMQLFNLPTSAPSYSGGVWRDGTTLRITN